MYTHIFRICPTNSFEIGSISKEFNQAEPEFMNMSPCN